VNGFAVGKTASTVTFVGHSSEMLIV